MESFAIELSALGCHNHPRKTQMFVALDTNSWFRERLLRSGLGATLLYALRQSGARLVMPQVVRAETIARLTEEGARAVGSIKDDLATVAALTGNRPDPDLPSDEALRQAIEARLRDLAGFIDELEPSMEDFANALRRVIEKRPPNERKEQFRDSLILEQLLRRYPNEEGFVVTNDGDFFAAKVRRDLAPALAREFAERRSHLRVVATIEEVLTGLGQEALRPDREAILRALNGQIMIKLQNHSNVHGYEIGEPVESKIEAFLTEHHDRLFVSFEISWRALGIPLSDGTILPEGVVGSTGTALFDLLTDEASKVQITKVHVRSLAGEVIHQDATVYAEGAIFLGARTAPYYLRRRLGH